MRKGNAKALPFLFVHHKGCAKRGAHFSKDKL
jgi:hypothetical protein